MHNENNNMRRTLWQEITCLKTTREVLKILILRFKREVKFLLF